MGDVVNFNPRKDLVGFCKQCLDDYHAGVITDLVFVYRRKIENKAELRWHWWGEESCTFCLGLIERTKGHIMDWIKNEE